MKATVLALVVMAALWGGLITVYDDAGRAHVLQISETGGMGRAWQVHDMTTGRSWTIETEGLPTSSYTEDTYRPAPRQSMRELYPDLFFVDGF